MIPILFPANATEFNTRGLGPLSDAVSCKVVEERNNLYELTLTYPSNGIHYEDLEIGNIICAIPSPYRSAQAFRIYKISKPMRGTITVNAQHISYDLSGVAVTPIRGGSMSDIFREIKIHGVPENNFTFTGDGKGTTVVYETPNTARQILGGMTGSLLDVFGGEYEFDNFNVIWHEHRGRDNGVSIRYGKNLLDVKQEIDSSSVITGVVPYWVNGETKKVVSGGVVKMTGSFVVDRYVPLNLSDKFDGEPSVKQLEDAAATYIKNNYSVDPKLNSTISFALIERTAEYKDFAALEKCDLCDIINVQYKDIGINFKSEIVKIDTDVLHEKYNSMDIGTVRANIAQSIIQQQKTLGSISDDMPTMEGITGYVQRELGRITGAEGGTVRLVDTNNDGEPDELYIADDPDPNKAQKVWRFNYLGWAASANGYDGPFSMGATLDAGLLAEFVTAAHLTAGTIQSMDGETFYLDLDNGTLRMNAESIELNSKSIETVIDENAKQNAKDAANKAVNDFVSATYDPKIVELQKQIDGQIESYFYDYAPELNNIPASNWKDETERLKHEGDLFFNKSTGYAYRFFKNGNVWTWQQVQDTDITKALQDAAKAQDTADKKRRVFVETPYPPYDVGDLWVQGDNPETGEIMRCATARASGSYNPADWVKASKYTDDTLADEAFQKVVTAETKIEQNTKEIALRATKEEVNVISKDVSNLQAEVSVQAEQIALKASQEDLENSLGSVQVEYYLSESSTELKGGQWSTTAPPWVNGKFMWQRTTTYRMDGSTHSSTATCIAGATGATGAAGAPGAAGANGKGVSKVTPQYYLSTSDQNTTGGNWSNTPPVIDKNKYLWTRSHVEYTDGTSYDSTAVLDKSLNDLTNRVTSAEATLTVQAGQIQSKASQSSVDSLGNRIGAAESTITQQATQIASKVTSGEVESIIEQNADSIRLKATKLAWEADNSSLTDEGKFTCNGAQINGHMTTRASSTGDYLEIDYGHIYGRYTGTSVTGQEFGDLDLVDNQYVNGALLQGTTLTGGVFAINVNGIKIVKPTAGIEIDGKKAYSGTLDSGMRFIDGICVAPGDGSGGGGGGSTIPDTVSGYNVSVTGTNDVDITAYNDCNISSSAFMRLNADTSIFLSSNRGSITISAGYALTINADVRIYDGSTYDQGYTGTINGTKFVHGICVGPA